MYYYERKIYSFIIPNEFGNENLIKLIKSCLDIQTFQPCNFGQRSIRHIRGPKYIRCFYGMLAIN